MIARTVFAASATTAGWVTIGYPLAVACLPRRPVAGPDDVQRHAGPPTVTVVLAAYREHDRLPAKLRALREQTHPADRTTLVVAIDGDATLAVAARAAAPDATIVLLDERRGKPTALNAAIAHAHGEIVVLTDAHTPLAPDAIRQAVAAFADPTVGGVTGRWATTGGLYAAYEERLLRWESRSGSVAGAYGSFFAVRRTLFPRYPPDVVNDDLWLLLRLLQGGHRVVYEPAAAATEPALASRHELERRRRIGAGRIQLVREIGRLPPAVAWRVASHKLGRLMLPIAALGAFGSSVALARRPLFRTLAALQAAGLAGAALAAGGIAPGGRSGASSRVARELTVGLTGTAAGVVRGLRSTQDVRWTAVR